MILLTRPYKYSADLAKILGRKNCIIQPMMEIEYLKHIIEGSFQALIATSKHALPLRPEPHVAGRNGGWVFIPTHGKNAAEILDYCIQNLKPKNGRIVYLSGNNITMDIADELNKKGFRAHRVITYKQHPTLELSDEFLGSFDKIKIATFFSKQTLKNFLSLAEKYNLDTKNITCICISENVSRETLAKNWHEIVIAQTADFDGMVKAIQAAT